MPLFGSKLTETQQAEINSVAASMNKLGLVHTGTFDGMAAQLRELYLECQAAQRAGLGRLTIPEGTILNEARRYLEQHQLHIDNIHAELQQVQIREWFPKKLRRQHDEWLQYLSTERKFLSTAIEGINPPEPLVDRPGAAKLNMFLSGLNLAATMARAFRRQVKS